MAQFTINSTRIDPYKNFKFRVVWDGQAVTGISKVSGLKRTTEVVSHRDGGDLSTKRHSPGSRRSKRSPSSAASPTTTPSKSGRSRRIGRRRRRRVAQEFPQGHDVELYNLQGSKVRAWQVFKCGSPSSPPSRVGRERERRRVRNHHHAAERGIRPRRAVTEAEETWRPASRWSHGCSPSMLPRNSSGQFAHRTASVDRRRRTDVDRPRCRRRNRPARSAGADAHDKHDVGLGDRPRSRAVVPGALRTIGRVSVGVCIVR